MSTGDSFSFPRGVSISARKRAVGGGEDRTNTPTGGDTPSRNFYTAFVRWRRRSTPLRLAFACWLTTCGRLRASASSLQSPHSARKKCRRRWL